MKYYIDQEEAAMKAKAIEDKERAQRVKQGSLNARDPLDLVEQKKIFMLQQKPFKDSIKRGEDAAYK